MNSRHEHESATEDGDNATRLHELDRSVSMVEVTGFEARHYDGLMNLITVGTYPRFIHRVVRDMNVAEDDDILILGAGTGRNACLMHRYLSNEGSILGLDIGDEMLTQAKRRCRSHKNITFEKRRIDEELPYGEAFDKVFMAFVMHGFVQEDRDRIIDNAFRALRAGGQFLILDYSECEPDESSWLVRRVFQMECPLATDFVRRDFQGILAAHGFDHFDVHLYYFGHVRLLAARRPPVSPEELSKDSQG
jgi:demethylmenaquinone methyltransferase/2-methoxy-6-polyprenyl-1,4-benzoquinol methylase